MYYIGCSGWHYRHWMRVFYPENLEQKEWLSFYAQHFNTVEVNSTFYNWPPADVFDQWKERAPAHFRYAFKMHNQITHRRRFRETYSFIHCFYQMAQRLGSKLGPFLFQLPPSIKCDMEFLEGAVAQLDCKKYMNVFEFRDPSWYNEEVWKFLRKKRVAFCCVHGGTLPRVLVATAPFFYARLHGTESYRHQYTAEQLKEIADQIRAIKGVKDYYIYFDNDYEGNAVLNAQTLQTYMREVKRRASQTTVERTRRSSR